MKKRGRPKLEGGRPKLDEVRPYAQTNPYRVEGVCLMCRVIGKSLMKCYQCPVAFHKECLGGEGYRGKWLCYLCKIVKKGIYEESTIVSALNEARLC